MNSESTNHSVEIASRQTKVITIASGKGGAGKSLLTLALSQLINDAPVFNSCVIIDLDFHVKGLTLLWYSDLSLLENEKWSIYDLLMREGALPTEWPLVKSSASIVIPSYQRVREPLDYDSISQMSFDHISKGLSTLLTSLDGKADFVLIDTRAGIDSFSLAASLMADLTIIVSEQDRISYRACFDLQSQIMIRAKEQQQRQN
ncbi:MAG: AAA family ATPase [Planctomycetes bacterium]|nr:AAA family ATPase [Planctomycetota bacterium]